MFFSRGPNKIQNPYTLRDMYEEYIEGVDENSPYMVPYSQYRAICEDFYKQMMIHILEHARSFKMPYNIGRIFVNKTKVKIAKGKKHLSIDWELTNKHGKVIYHLNEHSRGYKYIFVWEKKNFKLKNKTWYRFVATRANKRKLAKLIKSGNYDFFERY